MLNYSERKVLRYLQNNQQSKKDFDFKFVDGMYDELGDKVKLTKTLLSLEIDGFISLNKAQVNQEYITTYKTGNEIYSITGISLNEQGLIYDINYKKTILNHFWFSFLLPVAVSVTATICTWLLMK